MRESFIFWGGFVMLHTPQPLDKLANILPEYFLISKETLRFIFYKMKEYTEDSKNVSRRKSIEFAVNTLTKDRSNASIARPTYVREVYNYLKSKGSEFDKSIIKYLEEKGIEKWEVFYNSQIGTKKPSELKVAYLSGPNPLNDLQEFVKHGIIPENLYAFESDIALYDKAIINALNSEFPFIKIFKGKIENYFKILQHKYDIIYLDFCGTLASNNTISVLRDLFLYQKLNSPGVVITNFALPQRQKGKDEYWDNLIAFSTNYLFPKPFTEKLEKYGGGIREAASAYGLMPHDYLKLTFQNPNTVYSQCITRMLYDLPSLLIPYQRFTSNRNLIDTFFKNFEVALLPSDRDEDIFTFPENYSLIWGLNNHFITKPKFDEILVRVQRQLAFDSNNNKFKETLNLMNFFLHSHLDAKYNSEKLNQIEKRWKFDEKYVFCDAFLFHQLKELLVGQLTSPYLYNVSKTKRWTYKAKTNRMFVDAVTYDECKYIFDWMPTLDMFEQAVNTMDRQLILRFALDSVSKQRRWYNEELFMGTAVIDQNENGFEAKELGKRIKIN